MNLCEPSTLKSVLSRHGLWARKGLGQHFLCSSSAVDAIVSAADGAAGVLEIGPGPGVLTFPLSQSCEKILAVELDADMVRILQETAPEAVVMQLDALQADWSLLLETLPTPRAIVSNMPYYITGALLQKAAQCAGLIDVAVLMMQHEVASRILAAPGQRERGSLSVYLQGLFHIKKVVEVPAGAFLPPPKVSSTVLKLVPRQDPISEQTQRVVRAGFVQPRKTLANNLSSLGLGRERVESALVSAGLEVKVRPHQLTETQWVALSEHLQG